MATVLRAGRSGFRIPVAARIFSLEDIHTTVGGGPPSLLLNGYRVKQPGREADHLHLVPKLRMSGAMSLLPLYVLGVNKEEIFNVIKY